VPLGTAGGPTLLDTARAGVSTAIVHAGRVYLVDLGLGAYNRLVNSGIAPGLANGDLLGNVRGIFFTHLHSDHVSDWPALYVTGVSNAIGRTAPTTGSTPTACRRCRRVRRPQPRTSTVAAMVATRAGRSQPMPSVTTNARVGAAVPVSAAKRAFIASSPRCPQ
jgi:hypothetical protein